MINCKLLFVFLLISNTFTIDYALKVEKIIGGYRSWQKNFKYQAAIVGKYNFSDVPYLLCSAGIISDYLLLSVARCFVFKNNELKKFSFFAVVEADILKAKKIVLKEIEKIYTYHYNNLAFTSDLAITKLNKSLDLQNNANLAPLGIPQKFETYHGQTGIVAGFGLDAIGNIKKHGNRERVRITIKYGLQLKHANVTIINDGQFRQFESTDNITSICGENIYYFIEICGIIAPVEMYAHRGICVGDNGAPLVVGNKLVGIVSMHRKDCDDTIVGTTYTKVSNYKEFIDAVKEERILSGTKVFDNLRYLSDTVANGNLLE